MMLIIAPVGLGNHGVEGTAGSLEQSAHRPMDKKIPTLTPDTMVR